MYVEELIKALDYIEDNICDDMRVQDIADACYVSLSNLQKTFKYAFHMSINEYILRRRFTLAAKELLDTDLSILDIAVKYGYENAESFTRGFKKIWNLNPSEYRKKRKFSGHTPKLSVFNNKAEVGIMSGTKYDLSELYDVIQDRKNKAYICADLEGLMWINDNLGRRCGDEALLELMRRVDEACGEDDILLRIGGDEFVVFTNREDIGYADKIVKKVSEQNGNTINVDGVEMAVGVHIGAFKMENNKRVNVVEALEEVSKGMDRIHKN